MISKRAFHAAKNRCCRLLVSRGYAPVVPVADHPLSGFTKLHLIGLKGTYEALCIRIRHVEGAVSPEYVEYACRFECCQLRSLLEKYPGDIFLRCEVWAISPTGGIHCYEITADSLTEVAAYVR
ncbi:MAG TPA: hypothetical protein P5217_07375 [Methanoregulaceae archaeon]|nr:hypothetical protein [Methanoregulaceae archaeon]HPD76761.1 hypothetical protein [Methanoregulaceae archaeon]HRY76088.1 hypothetical protein [Methanoregulaceae archaeon]